MQCPFLFLLVIFDSTNSPVSVSKCWCTALLTSRCLSVRRYLFFLYGCYKPVALLSHAVLQILPSYTASYKCYLFLIYPLLWRFNQQHSLESQMNVMSLSVVFTHLWVNTLTTPNMTLFSFQHSRLGSCQAISGYLLVQLIDCFLQNFKTNDSRVCKWLDFVQIFHWKHRKSHKQWSTDCRNTRSHWTSETTKYRGSSVVLKGTPAVFMLQWTEGERPSSSTGRFLQPMWRDGLQTESEIKMMNIKGGCDIQLCTVH